MNKSTLYRVWDKKNKLWLENVLISSTGELFLFSNDEEMYCDKLSQDTGRYIFNKGISMMDINKKEIFEDDIIKAVHNSCETIGVVKYASPQYVLVSFENVLPITYFEKCEVIGNIRENSDLII